MFWEYFRELLLIPLKLVLFALHRAEFSCVYGVRTESDVTSRLGHLLTGKEVMGGMKQIAGIPLTICAYEFFSPVMVYIYFHFDFLYALFPELSFLIILAERLCLGHRPEVTV